MAKRKAAKAPKRGRPSKLTDEVQGKIIQALSGGNFRTVAAAWAGVGQRTLHEWMQKGLAEPSSRQGLFRRAVLEAEKAAEIRAVALVMKAASEDARHAQWWLSHRHATRWAEKRKVELTEKPDDPFAKMTDEQLLGFVEDELRKRSSRASVAGDL